MSSNANDQQQRILTALKMRAAAGQIDRRGFLDLAAAIGIQSAFAVELADQVMAAPAVRGHCRRGIAASYDCIVIGAGSAGCTLAARLSEDVACRVLLIEAGGSDINRPAIQSPVLWPSNFGTDVDWAYRTTPQARAAGRVIDWPRGKIEQHQCDDMGLGSCGRLRSLGRGRRRGMGLCTAQASVSKH
jgi:choline dehydrogenase